MFMAKKERTGRAGGGALTGVVTVSGDPAGVWLEGERRGVAVYAPGGYQWVPGRGEEMLVLKAGVQGEKPCAVGVPSGSGDLAPGEVRIVAGKSSIRLGLDGVIDVTGTLKVNGRSVVLEEEGL